MILTEEDLLKFVDSFSDIDEYSADKRSNPQAYLRKARMDSSNSDVLETPTTDDMHKTKHTKNNILVGTYEDSETKLCTVEKTKECANTTNATRTRDTFGENDDKTKVNLTYNLDKMNKTESEDSNSTTETNIKDMYRPVCNTIPSKPKDQVHAESIKSKTQKLKFQGGKLKTESKCKETNSEISKAETDRESHYMKNVKETCLKKTVLADEKKQPHSSKNMETFSKSPEKVKLTVNNTCEGTLSPVIKRADKELNVYTPRCKRKLDCSPVDEGVKKKIKGPVNLVCPEEAQPKDGTEETYTAEVWKPSKHISSNNMPPTSDNASQDRRQAESMLSSIYPENISKNLHATGDENDDEIDDFLVIPPSNFDSDTDIELKDLEGDVSFQDHDFPEPCIPPLEQFRITSPIRLCVVKLFGKKGGIYS